jgi:hypothetical protein
MMKGEYGFFQAVKNASKLVGFDSNRLFSGPPDA